MKSAVQRLTVITMMYETKGIPAFGGLRNAPTITQPECVSSQFISSSHLIALLCSAATLYLLACEINQA